MLYPIRAESEGIRDKRNSRLMAREEGAPPWRNGNISDTEVHAALPAMRAFVPRRCVADSVKYNKVWLSSIVIQTLNILKIIFSKIPIDILEQNFHNGYL